MLHWSIHTSSFLLFWKLWTEKYTWLRLVWHWMEEGCGQDVLMLLFKIWKSLNSRYFGSPGSVPNTAAGTTVLLSVYVVVVGRTVNSTEAAVLLPSGLDYFHECLSTSRLNNFCSEFQSVVCVKKYVNRYCHIVDIFSFWKKTILP